MSFDYFAAANAMNAYQGKWVQINIHGVSKEEFDSLGCTSQKKLSTGALAKTLDMGENGEINVYYDETD